MTKSDDLQLTQNAAIILKERYLRKDEEGRLLETELELFRRVAHYVASVEESYGKDPKDASQRFLNAMLSLDFLPNSPTLMNAGTKLGQLAACFVLPLEDTLEGIFKTVEHSVRIQATGGGVGFAFSRIRPTGDTVRSSEGTAAGPVPFLHVFDAATESIKYSGKRRGANMGVLRVDHPDIEQFVESKKDPAVLSNFNLSVGVTDAFMSAVAADDSFDLVNPRTKEVAKTIGARGLFDKIVALAWETGDPGMIFLDRINRDNPTPHLGPIEGTNPCGETPLLPYESCVLGSVNLSHMVADGRIDWKKLAEVVRIGVQFLDNILDLNDYPLPEIKQATLLTRKVGLGVMGWADALVKLQLPYDSEEAVIAGQDIMEFISFHAKTASVQLAQERGPFPEYQENKHKFIPDHSAKKEKSADFAPHGRPSLDWEALGRRIHDHGMRNATVTTIAPTGSISTIAGASSGIEPLFALAYTRRILGQELYEIHGLFQEVARQCGCASPAVMQEVIERGGLTDIKVIPDEVRRLFATAHEIRPEWHVRMQSAFQRYVDNAVSKTVNLKSTASKEDVAHAYLLSYELECKGVTVYRDGSKDRQVLSGGIQQLLQTTVEPRPVPNGKLEAWSYSTGTPTGKMTLFVREYEGRPFDAFVILGRSGSDITAFTEAIGRLLSIAFRCNIPVEILAENLVGLGGRTSVGFGPERILSVPDAIGRLLQREYCGTRDSYPRGEICPDCKNASLEYTEGCLKCPLCGFAEC